MVDAEQPEYAVEPAGHDEGAEVTGSRPEVFDRFLAVAALS
jgi:hypothetical protein